jgi:DNA processing protein
MHDEMIETQIRDKIVYYAMLGVCPPMLLGHMYTSWRQNINMPLAAIIWSYPPTASFKNKNVLLDKIKDAAMENPWDQTFQRYDEKGIQALMVMDEEYPIGWLNSYMPPIVLFYKGDIKLLAKNSISVVGSRYPSLYGEEAIRRLLPPLVAEDVVTVSGLAKGIDRAVHMQTIANRGQTIGIIGTGLDIYYPNENVLLQQEMMREHLVMTEYPLGSRPEKYHFPMRNRLIASLSQATLVIEAKEQSGSLITANVALQENREVFAVPGNITNPLSVGTNQLIKAGAGCVLEAADILSDMRHLWK